MVVSGIVLIEVKSVTGVLKLKRAVIIEIFKIGLKKDKVIKFGCFKKKWRKNFRNI